MASIHNTITRREGNKSDDFILFICGHCDSKVSGAIIADIRAPNGPHTFWLLCPNCMCGSVKVQNVISPSSMPGPDIVGLPAEVNTAYQEARRCMSVGAYTACELICRKLLMHVAADKGAKEGETFANYLSYLEQAGYITPPMKGWADLIRQHGNLSTHKLDTPTPDRAESTLMFIAELLRLIYEMEHLKTKYTPLP